ncbi:spore germination protein [Limnochorda pilosa]|uniref:Spore gernimation protein GerA n=1 Tax=Limnochorda pilosa TaxID=1555112 RepID=A0A0K2SKG4_LIMPI|nr:spore germination protein [Limnochorda pilosa]BAS27329.1 spore gernimation protein GerA [Limnochorda pilosa]
MERTGVHRDQAEGLEALRAAAEILEELPLSESLDLNLGTLDRLFHGSSDWVCRSFRIAGGRKAAIAYLDGLLDSARLDDSVLRPLLYEAFPIRTHVAGGEEVGRILEQHAVALSHVKKVTTVSELADGILHGDAALLVDGESSGTLLNARAFEHRSVDEPESESVIRGPHEGFVESLNTNTALLRRRIRTPQLKLDRSRVGHLSRTDVVIAYVRGVAPETLVREVQRRVSGIRIDGVIDSAYIEELIEDYPYSPFPQALVTERPDAVAGNLLEGRVAILVDGSPFALVVPTTLFGLMQASEDYYERFYVGTALRALRYLFAFLALLLPSLYVAITTFHQEMIPTALLLTLAATREGIPFPSIVEVLMMEVSFEALREAGIRLPKPIGQAVTIVGALVIGQASVQAGIVSAPVVIIVALTGIASFTFPRFNLGITIRLIRFPMIFLAATLGLYGIILGLLGILVHLCRLRSFGIPYLSPVTPLTTGDLADAALRVPIWLRGLRPRLVGHANPRRQPERARAPRGPYEDDQVPRDDGAGRAEG